MLIRTLWAKTFKKFVNFNLYYREYIDIIFSYKMVSSEYKKKTIAS